METLRVNERTHDKVLSISFQNSVFYAVIMQLMHDNLTNKILKHIINKGQSQPKHYN